MVVSLVGHDSGVPLLLAFPVTVALALGVTQLLAVGMTSPLREMTEAARRMARGDYRGRVRAESADEVGELARAFNQMATELDTVDKEQRALVATVSHELRTPLAGLTAVLENLADGVVPPDEEHLEAAVGQARRLSDLVGDLLELSRVDAGVAPLRLADVDVADLLDETVAELVPTGRAVSFAVDVADGLTVAGRPGPAAAAGRQPARQRRAPRPRARHGPDPRRRSTATAGASRSPTTARACRPPTASGPSSASAPWPPTPAARRPAAPGLGLAIARWVATLHGGTVRFVDPPTGTTGAVLRVDLPLDPPARGATAPAAVPLPAAHPPEVAMTETASAPSPAPPVDGAPVDVPPVIDPLFGRHWPDASGAGRPVVLAAVGVGVLAGLLIPYRDLGLAFFLVLARCRRHGLVGREAPPRPVHGHLPGAGGAVHAAGRAAGRRVDRGPVPAGRHGQPGRRGDPRTPPAGVRRRRLGLAAVRASWAALARPQPARHPRHRPRPSHRADRRCGRRGAVLVFGLLFASADAVVADWARRRAARPDARARSCSAASPASSSAARRSRRRTSPSTRPTSRPFPAAPPAAAAHRFEWLVPVLLVDAVFAVFVAAQAAVLFGGHDYVQRSDRADVRRVRAPGIRAAHGRDPADAHRGLGRVPPGRPRARATGCGCASRSASCAR